MARGKTEIYGQWLGGSLVMADQGKSTGNRFWVDSGAGTDAAGYGYSPTAPAATLDYAVGLCTASNGDVIYVMPGHAENLAADSAVDIDIAGITVIGLGYGAARPTFTATAITGDFKLAAASTRIENLLFLSGIDATTGMVEVSGADCQIINCEFRDSVDQATDCLITTAAADRLLIDGCKWVMAAADGGDTAVCLVGADDTVIRNCQFYGNFDLGAIECRTTLSARIWVHDCYIWTAAGEDLAIKDTVTSSTGCIGPNVFIMVADNAANITEAITGATFHVMDPVYVCNLVNEKAMLINWTASTDA